MGVYTSIDGPTFSQIPRTVGHTVKHLTKRMYSSLKMSVFYIIYTALYCLGMFRMVALSIALFGIIICIVHINLTMILQIILLLHTGIHTIPEGAILISIEVHSRGT